MVSDYVSLMDILFGLTCEIYSGSGPLNVCILRGLLLRDSSPICKKCCCVFVHNNTLDNDSERTISSLYSLKVFLPISSQFIGCSGEVVLSGVVVTTDDVVVSIAVLPVVNVNSHEETTICVPWKDLINIFACKEKKPKWCWNRK